MSLDGKIMEINPDVELIVAWLSPHTRPDWVDHIGLELYDENQSQGGQTVVMWQEPRAIIQQFPNIEVHAVTRYMAGDPQIDSEDQRFKGKPVYHDSEAGIHIKEIDEEGRFKIIRLPAGPIDDYIPKEIMYGSPITQLGRELSSLSQRVGFNYDILHGHYADGWEAARKAKILLPYDPGLALTTHSVGLMKRQGLIQEMENSLIRQGIEGEELRGKVMEYKDKIDAQFNFTGRALSERDSLRLADIVLPLSSVDGGFLETEYRVNPNKTQIMPNGIDPREFQPGTEGDRWNIREALKISDEDFVYLAPSRIDPRKGTDLLVRAFHQAFPNPEEANAKLLLLVWPTKSPYDEWDDYTQGVYNYIEHNNLEDSVILHEGVPHELMPKIYAASDVGVLASQEYFSIAMLEIMRCGLPVLASIYSSARDVIGSKNGLDDNGALIETGLNQALGFYLDHTVQSKLATSLRELRELGGTNPDLLQIIGNNGQSTILDNYTWESVSARLYREVYVPLNE